ncbi:MAG: peptide chain release factor-like protein [Nitrospirae bacterium]|nr:peptide chain release factor-like protein [Nitrospirota bacterium]
MADRICPVDAGAKKFPVRPETAAELYERMSQAGLFEADIEESFIRCGGHGGQKVNKTSSGVYLVHRPTGTEVKCTKERSQGLNRFFARRMLVAKLVELSGGEKTPATSIADKIRKQKRRRMARSRSGGNAGQDLTSPAKGRERTDEKN